MLSDSPVCPIFAVKDIEVSKKFYTESLGLKESAKSSDQMPMLEAGKGSLIVLYQKDNPDPSEDTAVGFDVDDLESLMTELRGKGVKFEDYDLPGLKTVNGVASFGPVKTAWLKDPDGHIIALNQNS